MNKLSHRAGAEAVETGTPFAACGYINAVSPMLGGSLGSFIRRLRNMVGRQLADLRGADRPRAITNFLRSLHHRQDWLNRPSKHRKMAIKYVVRALCMPRQHGRYLAFVFGNPHMCACQRRDPRMLERHFHRYIHLQWDRPTRLQSIQRHYRFALAQLPCALFEAIYVYGNATLGNLTLKDGGQLKLCLRPPISVGCEGELCIQLSDADDHPVYRLILTVIGDRPTIAIGCLQGPDDQNGKDMVRDMTKNMYGMRPKQLMLSLAYAFAKHFRIERILAVSNAAHPLRRVRDKFRADYDAFWLEQKGSDVGNGWFMLPEALSRKSESEVSSHHRSAFRRREIMRIEAERLLIDALEAYPSRSSATPSGKELESVGSSQHDNLDASWIR